MRIGILSDSHGGNENLKKAVELMMGKVDMIIHLGDFILDTWSIKDIYSGPVYSLIGNNDEILA